MAMRVLVTTMDGREVELFADEVEVEELSIAYGEHVNEWIWADTGRGIAPTHMVKVISSHRYHVMKESK